MVFTDNSNSPVRVDSNFIRVPFSGKNSFWRYFIGSLSPFIVSNIVGAIPMLIVMFMYAGGGIIPQSGGMPDFKAMGIDLNLGFVLTVFPFILAFFTLALLVKPLNDRPLLTIVNGGSRVRWGRMLFSALVWIALSALWLWYSIRSDPGNFSLNNTSRSLIALAVLSVLLIPFQAGFEEMLFRGYLMQGFTVLARNRWVPVVVTSVIFGLMHSLNPEVKEYGFLTMIPQYVFFGLAFAVLTMMDDGIELAVGAHAANNAFLSVFVTHKDSALQTPAMYEQMEIYPWQDFAGLVIMSVIFIMIMALAYRWKDAGKLYARVDLSDRVNAC
jgi:membrane protease YdiL (CAAX protease family)